MADIKSRLAAHWGRHLAGVPESWLIDWVMAENDDSGARVTAVVAHVVTGELHKGATAVQVYAPVWVALRSLSDRLRVPHIVVAEFGDALLYRAWPPQSGMQYQSKLVEDFIMTSIQLEPESWKEVP